MRRLSSTYSSWKGLEYDRARACKGRKAVKEQFENDLESGTRRSYDGNVPYHDDAQKKR